MPPRIPTVYFDHSALANDACWQVLTAMCAGGHVQPIVSLWNLYEIGEATDVQQKAARIAFMRSLKPRWVAERTTLQREEIKRYVGPPLFRADYPVIAPFQDQLSKVDQLWQGGKRRLHLTPGQWISEIDYSQSPKLKSYSKTALRALQEMDEAERLDRQTDRFGPWIRNLIPKRSPSGNPISELERAIMIEYCSADRASFLDACRSLAFENAMTLARTNNPRRNPTHSDAIDLFHGVVALSYCDYFVCRDGYLRTCADVSRRALQGSSWAEVGTPDDILAMLQGRGIVP